jgi:DNA-binding winged helix-turn-helix (wHTH) protein/TolB-like protein
MAAGRFRFGLFELDTATCELRREEALVRLQSQPAQVLACLVARPGEVVSREELRKAIWGSETFVDFDRGLNFCIGQIRSTLDDDSVTPRYIRTLPKRGYQFIAPVERIGESVAESPKGAKAASARPRFRAATAVWVCAGVLLLALAVGAGYWLRSSRSAKHRPIVAVLRFDNETSDPGMTRFADGLTDNVVEQLTVQSGGQYDVIGNASILRLPREQRDLRAIFLSLHAGYVVLGQVQSNGAQTRILVHLIRLPDQTHVWVARMDRTIADPLAIESEAAQKVGAEFSERIAKDSSGTPLPEAASH